MGIRSVAPVRRSPTSSFDLRSRASAARRSAPCPDGALTARVTLAMYGVRPKFNKSVVITHNRILDSEHAVLGRLDAAARLTCSDSQAKPSSFNNAHSASNGLFRFRRTGFPSAGLLVLPTGSCIRT